MDVLLDDPRKESGRTEKAATLSVNRNDLAATREEAARRRKEAMIIVHCLLQPLIVVLVTIYLLSEEVKVMAPIGTFLVPAAT